MIKWYRLYLINQVAQDLVLLNIAKLVLKTNIKQALKIVTNVKCRQRRRNFLRG